MPTCTYTSRRDTDVTVPETISPVRSLYSESVFARSASRIFCIITWRDVCAATRPSLDAGSSISIVSPFWMSGFSLRAFASEMNPGPVSSFEATIVSYTWMFRFLRSIDTRRSFVTPGLRRAACWMAPSMAVSTISRPTPRSRSMYCTIVSNSLFMAMDRSFMSKNNDRPRRTPVRRKNNV